MVALGKIIRECEEHPYKIDIAYRKRLYIVTHRSVYQPCYSVNAGFYAQEVYYSERIALTMPGRFFHVTGDEVNRLIGRKLLNNL